MEEGGIWEYLRKLDYNVKSVHKKGRRTKQLKDTHKNNPTLFTDISKKILIGTIIKNHLRILYYKKE